MSMTMFSYLDGGTLTLAATAIAGGLAGMAVFIRLYWHRFLGIFSKKHREKAMAAEEQLTGGSQEQS